VVGYVRQDTTGAIEPGEIARAQDINAEVNALDAAFSGVSGHTHTGGLGDGPKINLSTSVSGSLPANLVTGLSTVATTGDYDDLLNIPPPFTLPLPLADLAQGGATMGQLLRWSGSVWAPGSAEAGASWGSITGIPAAINSVSVLTPAADRIAYYTGTSTASLTTLTATGRDLIAAANMAAVRSLLNVADGATANTGTVTSVAVSGSDGIEIDSGSPITTSGTIALGVNASALRTHINVADGATANTGTVTSVAISASGGITVTSGSPVTTSGTIAVTIADAALTIAKTNGLQSALDGKAATSHTHAISDVTGLQTALDAKAPLTVSVGTALGTTGTVNLDLATLTGTTQRIDATGNIDFTASNYAAGRNVALRVSAGGSTRTISWPSWTPIGDALPTSLPSGKVLRVAIECVGTTAGETDAGASVQP
jgi:hypothetical protein